MRTMIAVPCMDMVHTDFLTSLMSLARPDGTAIAVSQGSQIHVARSNLALQAVRDGFDRVLWLDSDMTFAPDLLTRLSADLDAGWDAVCGIFFHRRFPPEPCIYPELDYDGHGAAVRPQAYWGYPRESVFPVAACGFGAVLMTADIIARAAEMFGDPFMPVEGIGEDLAFCWRAAQAGGKIACDSTVKVGHVGLTVYGESQYLLWESRRCEE